MNEIKSMELVITAETGVSIHQSIGSVLHGSLMDMIDGQYASVLHTQSVRPYSQCVYVDKERNSVIWKVSAFSADAVEEIIEPLLACPTDILLRQKGWHLHIEDKRIIDSTSYQELAFQWLGTSHDYRYIDLHFLTSTSFKSQGQYQIYPTTELVLQSLLRRWNAFSTGDVLEDDDLAKQLAHGTYVAGFQLHMHPFSVEHVRIPAFRGHYKIGLKHNSMINKVVSLLLAYSNFTGIGIKTALGMGGVCSNFMETQKRYDNSSLHTYKGDR